MPQTAREWRPASEAPGKFAGLYFVATEIAGSPVLGLTVATWTGGQWKTGLKVLFWMPIDWPEPPQR